MGEDPPSWAYGEYGDVDPTCLVLFLLMFAALVWLTLRRRAERGASLASPADADAETWESWCVMIRFPSDVAAAIRREPVRDERGRRGDAVAALLRGLASHLPGAETVEVSREVSPTLDAARTVAMRAPHTLASGDWSGAIVRVAPTAPLDLPPEPADAVLAGIAKRAEDGRLLAARIDWLVAGTAPPFR